MPVSLGILVFLYNFALQSNLIAMFACYTKKQPHAPLVSTKRGYRSMPPCTGARRLAVTTAKV